MYLCLLEARFKPNIFMTTGINQRNGCGPAACPGVVKKHSDILNLKNPNPQISLA
jgi:hypothetical protein